MPPMTNKHWAKGNLHTHSTNSDGDIAPEHVADWYAAHGYDFLSITDHDHLTIIEQSSNGSSKWPLLVRGQEVTSRDVNVHVNAFGIGYPVQSATGLSVVETLQRNVDAIRAAGGLASINHPNFRWAFDHRELSRVSGYALLEVFNGHDKANNEGGGGRPSTSSIWDRLLSARKRVWGIAVDDAHHFTEEFSCNRANPGRGWVAARVERLNEAEVLAALDAGDFYASSGPRIAELHTSHKEIVLEIDPGEEPDALYTTTFTGLNGAEIYSANGTTARYRPSRLDTYVRTTVSSSRGTRAWVQPIFMPEA